MNKVLIIAGQTATGKTAFAVEIAKKFNGELISADSRMVYKGMDIITGKDRDKIDVPVWLYDLVEPDELFSVSAWRQKALEAIHNISSRGKLPIVVGGTGLYLRSLTENLDTLEIPKDMELRNKKLSISELQKMLKPELFAKLNDSDRVNPRRLIRAIEISFSDKVPQFKIYNLKFKILSVTLTCAPTLLKHRISARVHQRISSGAILELQHLTSIFDPQSSSFTACGYKALLHSHDPEDWIRSEYQYARRQKVFFQKFFPENTVDISDSSWHSQLLDIITSWFAT